MIGVRVYQARSPVSRTILGFCGVIHVNADKSRTAM